MSPSLLSSQEHTPLRFDPAVSAYRSPTGKLINELMRGSSSWEKRTPLVLLGPERNAALLQNAFRDLESWQLPMMEGRLLGATSVWACAFTPSGTPAATLQGGGQSNITLAMADQAQIDALKDASGPSCQLASLPDCKVQLEEYLIDSPKIIAPWQGVLSVEGQPRAVAVNEAPGGPSPAIMIEISDWVCSKAIEAGMEIATPIELSQALQDPSNRSILIRALAPSLPHNLNFTIL